jgi:hypothetical protein
LRKRLRKPLIGFVPTWGDIHSAGAFANKLAGEVYEGSGESDYDFFWGQTDSERIGYWTKPNHWAKFRVINTNPNESTYVEATVAHSLYSTSGYGTDNAGHDHADHDHASSAQSVWRSDRAMKTWGSRPVVSHTR